MPVSYLVPTGICWWSSVNRCLFKRLRLVLEGFVVTMHEATCEQEVQSRSHKAKIWTYCLHKPKCMVTTQHNRLVSMTIITCHFCFHPIGVTILHLKGKYGFRSKSMPLWKISCHFPPKSTQSWYHKELVPIGVSWVPMDVCWWSGANNWHNINWLLLIVQFHNSFSPSGEQPKQRILAYKSEQLNAGCITLFHKYCCDIKYGGIITNLTMKSIPGDMLLLRQITTMWVYGAWIKIYYIICSKTYGIFSCLFWSSTGLQQAIRSTRICETQLFLWYK